MHADRPDFVEFVTPIADAVPVDVEAMFNECVRVGLYAEADRVSLRAMHQIDPAETRKLVVDMTERVDRCLRCRYLRRSGAAAHCVGRDFADDLPADRGARCSSFLPVAAHR